MKEMKTLLWVENWAKDTRALLEPLLVKKFVVDTAVQEMQSHVELYLALGTQGNCGWRCLGFPSWHSLL